MLWLFLLTLNKVGNEMSLRLMLNYSGESFVDMLKDLRHVNTAQSSSTNLKRKVFPSFQPNFKKLVFTPFALEIQSQTQAKGN